MGTIIREVVGILDIELLEAEKDTFNFSFLCEVIKKEIRNLPDDKIKVLSEKILDCGIESESFSTIDSAAKIYGLNVGRRGLPAAEKALQKYISHQAKKHAEKLQEEEQAEKRILKVLDCIKTV